MPPSLAGGDLMSQRRSLPGARGAGRGSGNAAGPGGTGNNAGARGALLLGVAVILGIVLLQQFDSDLDTGGGQVAATSIPSPDETTSTTRRSTGLTSVPQVTPTTARGRAKAEVKVLVANGAGVRGLGAATTNALKTAGYTTLPPTDATSQVERTAIQFAEGFEAEARELAGLIGQPATVVARLAAPPVAAAEIEGANVIVILGVDVTTSTTTAAGAGTTTSTTRRL